MKKTVKRLFALLLVLCLLSAEFPAAVFAAGTSIDVSQSAGNTSNQSQNSTATPLEDEGVKIVYNLASGFGSWENLVKVSLEKTNNFWSHAVTTGYSASVVRKYGGNNYLEITHPWVGAISAFQIYVPVEGTYDLSVTHGILKTADTFNVYVVRGAEYYEGSCSSAYAVAGNGFSNTAISNALKNAVAYNDSLATDAAVVQMEGFSCYDASKSSISAKSSACGSVKLEAGYHLVVLSSSEKGNADDNLTAYVRSFTLTGGDGVAVMKMSAAAEKTVLMPGGKTQINVSAYLSNPSVTGLTYTYVSDNQNVAIVSAEGVVTAVAEGTTQIMVNAVVDGKTVGSRKVDITVRMPDLTGLKLVYDLKAT